MRWIRGTVASSVGAAVAVAAAVGRVLLVFEFEFEVDFKSGGEVAVEFEFEVGFESRVEVEVAVWGGAGAFGSRGVVGRTHFR